MAPEGKAHRTTGGTRDQEMELRLMEQSVLSYHKGFLRNKFTHGSQAASHVPDNDERKKEMGMAPVTQAHAPPASTIGWGSHHLCSPLLSMTCFLVFSYLRVWLRKQTH